MNAHKEDRDRRTSIAPESNRSANREEREAEGTGTDASADASAVRTNNREHARADGHAAIGPNGPTAVGPNGILTGHATLSAAGTLAESATAARERSDPPLHTDPGTLALVAGREALATRVDALLLERDQLHADLAVLLRDRDSLEAQLGDALATLARRTAERDAALTQRDRARAGLRAIRRVLDGTQPRDVNGAVMAIDHALRESGAALRAEVSP